MIRAIIVDDEWYNLEEIADLLIATGAFSEPRKYLNPVIALKEAEINKPEVAFVDIEMPVINGINFARKLNLINPDIVVVFVTAWNQYAVDAFDVNALDYILKPINQVRFKKMIDRVKYEIFNLRAKMVRDLQISCFGNLQVQIDHVPIKWERAKSEELFAFLLMHHNKYVSKEVIIEYLWPEYETQKALQILQTAVSRIRTIFSELDTQVEICYHQSAYCLSITDAKCDLFGMELTLQSFKHTDEEDLKKLDDAIELCRKGFLSEHGYLWSFEKDEEIKQQLVLILKALIEPKSSRLGKGRLKYLRCLAELLPYEDSINYQLLQIYINIGYESVARQYYKWLVKTLKDQYDIEPSQRIKKLFDYGEK